MKKIILCLAAFFAAFSSFNAQEKPPSDSQQKNYFAFILMGVAPPITRDVSKDGSGSEIRNLAPELTPPSVLFYKNEAASEKKSSEKKEPEYKTGILFLNGISDWFESTGSSFTLSEKEMKGQDETYKPYISAKLPENSRGGVFFLTNPPNAKNWKKPRQTFVPLEYLLDQNYAPKGGVFIFNSLAVPVECTLDGRKTSLKANTYSLVPIDETKEEHNFEIFLFRGNVRTRLGGTDFNKPKTGIMAFFTFLNPFRPVAKGQEKVTRCVLTLPTVAPLGGKAETGSKDPRSK